MTTTTADPIVVAMDKGLRPVYFTLDDGEHGYVGVTDDTLWNGFLNVRTTPETLAQIIVDFTAMGAGSETTDREAWPPVDDDGLVNLSGGFATSEAEWGSDAHVDAENALGVKVGHPEACSWTLHATMDEILDHLLRGTSMGDDCYFAPCETCGQSEALHLDADNAPDSRDGLGCAYSDGTRQYA